MISNPTDSVNSLDPQKDNQSASSAAPAATANTPSAPSTNEPVADSPLTIEQVIDNALAGIQPGMLATALDEHLRNVCNTLVEHKASTIVCNGCYDQVRTRLKELKLPSLPKKDWTTFIGDAVATKQFNEGTSETAQVAHTLVETAVPGAPVSQGVVVPAGWLLGQHQLAKVCKEQNQPVCSMPLVISKLLVNDADNTVAVELAWKRNSHWQQHTVARSEIAAKNRIINLADYGLAITTGNADAVIDYLAQFEAINLHHLPQIQVRRQLGWVDKQHSGFLWGRSLLQGKVQQVGPSETELEVDGFLPGNASESPQPESPQVFFQGADAGDEQIADGFHAEGTFEDWAAAIAPALHFPKPKLVVLASLAAPLLSILGTKNFIVDLSGPSSKGKTITLRAAASCWGKPEEQAPDAAMTIWNSSRVWIERGAAILQNLPLILDDTRGARNQDDIPQVLYDIASGRGRGRGTTKGTERTLTWSTVLLTSGEAPATSHSQDGGTRARVLSLWGLPFEKADEETGKLVEALRTGVLLNYGHAGPRLLEYVLAHQDRWPTWQEWLRRVRACYIKKAQGNSVVMRLADALAAITVTGLLAWKALGLEDFKRSPVKSL